MPLMRTGDPETRIKEYWPITKAQIDGANQQRLFPDEKMIAATFKAEEFHTILNFAPPSGTPQKFGFPIRQQFASLQPAQSAPSHVVFVANYLSLPVEQIITLYNTEQSSFNRLNEVKGYVKNHLRNEHPHASFSQAEALALTDQEGSNLATCYAYVFAQSISLNEVKELSEAERQILSVQGSQEILQNSLNKLREYQDTINDDAAGNNPSLN